MLEGWRATKEERERESSGLSEEERTALPPFMGVTAALAKAG